MAIAVRLAQNWLGRHGRTVRREGTSLESAPEPGASATALTVLVADESRRRLWQAVAALPSEKRTVVMLYYRDEMAVRDIAHALGVTTGTVKTLLFRARRHLRAARAGGANAALRPHGGRPAAGIALYIAGLFIPLARKQRSASG